MKKTKLISIICALSMIFSMFTAVVNADNEKGIDLKASLSDDGTQITVEAFATGTTGNLANFTIAFEAPTGVTAADSVTATAPDGAALTKNVTAAGVVKVLRLDTTGAGFALPEDKKIADIVITLPDNAKLTSDYTITLTGDAAIQEVTDDTAAKVSKGTMDATTLTVEKWKDPNAKSDAEDRPAKQEESSDDTPVDVPVTSAKGIALESSISDDNKTITVTAKAVGTTGNLANFTIAFNAPEGVTSADQITATAPDGGALTKNVTASGVIKVLRLDTTGAGFAVPADGTIATITIELPNALTDPLALTFTDDAAIQEVTDDTAAKVSKGTMTATSTVVTPKAADKGTATTVDLEDYMGKDNTTGDDAATVAKAAEDAGKTIYITVDVTKEDENGNQVPATYGTDYEAVYDGKTLTEAQYNNLIHGYGLDGTGVNAEKISDVISKLQFKVYDTAKNAKIKTSLNSTDSDTQLVNDQEKTDVAPGETPVTPTQTTPSISVKSSTTQVTAGEGTVVKVYVDKITNENTDGKLTVTISDGALDLVTGSGIAFVDSENENSPVALKADGTTANEIEVGSASDKYIKFVGASKGSIKFTFNYTAKGDVTGEEVSAKAVDKTITIKAPTTTNGGGGSGSGSSSSGNGAIATGLVDIGGTGSLFGFTDMADASWATDAVNALAAQKIVSGVGDNKFDPNGALTRAAYAQMLVNAIGHSQDSADTEFYDVPTDAWFYHNVAVAAQLGIVSGYGDGNFGPYDLITREQMALMTQKAAVVMAKSLVGADAGQFTDDADIADWSRDAVYQLANAGIINGMGDGTFAPKANATRAQAAVIIYNTFVK